MDVLQATDNLDFYVDVLDAFEMYMAISTHFKKEEYDFFHYKGRFSRKVITYETLLKKNYKPALEKLSRTYKSKQLVNYFIANMLVRDGEYTFDTNAEGRRIYLEYMARKESRLYTFYSDIKKICTELDKRGISNFWKIALVEDGKHPLLLRMFIGNYVTPETMAILSKMQPYLNYWDKNITDTDMYPIVAKQIRKFEPFVFIKDLEIYEQEIKKVEKEVF